MNGLKTEKVKLSVTKVFDKNEAARKRLVINQGGTSSSKTWSILQLLLHEAIERDGLVISVVSETFPHVRRGAMRDFIMILHGIGIYDPAMHDKTNSTFHFGSSFIEFFGADSEDRVRGPRRDILFLNEVNNIKQSTFDQLEVRTKERVYLDYNPTHEFWIHEIMTYRNDYDYIHSTYKDNDLLDERIVKSIEQRMHKENWWKVYGLGKLGVLEGVIFKNWKMVDQFPKDCIDIIYGLDFGFTNDPTAIVKIGFYDGQIWLKEILYETDMTNQEIGKLIKAQGISETIIADSAEPKSIEEIYRMGIDIRPSDKGKDSVRFGIDILLGHRLCVTKSSVNLIKELRNYTWDKDKNGENMPKPIDLFNHLIDAMRYGVVHRLARKKKAGGWGTLRTQTARESYRLTAT